jgi:DNA-directed RNA polymerase subunit F
MTADVDVTVFPGDPTVEALTKVVEAHGFELRGADADVVAMKILSGRPKDQDDVIAIIAAQGPALNHHRVRETLELLEKALDRSDLVAELERAQTEATR